MLQLEMTFKTVERFHYLGLPYVALQTGEKPHRSRELLIEY